MRASLIRIKNKERKMSQQQAEEEIYIISMKRQI